MDLILKYFPDLTDLQKERFSALLPLYSEWNTKINVISRKDMDLFYTHHVLHSLTLTKVLPVKTGTRILDLGTGGGFPGIPLAIFFPEVSFMLVDSIGKKINVVRSIADSIGLSNVNAVHARTEHIKERFNFVVSRAVAPLPDLIKWTGNLFDKKNNGSVPNGIFCLKGGDLKQELAPYIKRATQIDITDFFNEPYFNEKKIIYLPCI